MKGKKVPGGCMPEMMKMMGSGGGPQSSLSDMCGRMMQAVTSTAEMTGFATPEVRALFDDWVGQVEVEILDVVRHKRQVTVQDIAQELKISEDSALYFLSKLIRDKKLVAPSYELP